MGFVFQDDLMLSNLTVQETIRTSAELKLPVNMNPEEKTTRVDALVKILGLTDVKDQKIGSISERGISGGERKRTAVANELVTAPSILFLDEPTSGLDSTTALSLVHTLRMLCDRGMTIICCIHQPRENIFNLFDKLLLLVEGRTSFFGPVLECKHYLETFQLPSGKWIKLPQLTTVADFILDLMCDKNIAIDMTSRWKQERKPELQQQITKIWNAVQTNNCSTDGNTCIVKRSYQDQNQMAQHPKSMCQTSEWCHKFRVCHPPFCIDALLT